MTVEQIAEVEKLLALVADAWGPYLDAHYEPMLDASEELDRVERRINRVVRAEANLEAYLRGVIQDERNNIGCRRDSYES